MPKPRRCASHAKPAKTCAARRCTSRSSRTITNRRCRRCSVAIIDAGIARVVVGALDPNVRTHGNGVARMRAAGVAVEVVDDTRSRALIERFAFTIGSLLPFVTLKMAMSLDGFVAPRPGTHRVTGEAARERVYDLRAEHDAVMVGAGTVRVDDPLLTVRPHRTRAKPYARVVVCGTAPLAANRAACSCRPPVRPPGSYAPTIVLAPGGLAARSRRWPHAARFCWPAPGGAAARSARGAARAARAGHRERVVRGRPDLGRRACSPRGWSNASCGSSRRLSCAARSHSGAGRRRPERDRKRMGLR